MMAENVPITVSTCVISAVVRAFAGYHTSGSWASVLPLKKERFSKKGRAWYVMNPHIMLHNRLVRQPRIPNDTPLAI
jgi:hypothetical protein